MAIVKNPNPILRQKLEKVPVKEISSKEIQDLVELMKKTVLETPDAIGLAANQVGSNKRIFVVSLPEDHGGYFGVFINPEITEKTDRTIIDDEGCLSIPKTYGPVIRPRGVKIKAYDEQGKQFKLRAKGLLARVIQHEMDHLEGKLFIDKAERTYKIES